MISYHKTHYLSIRKTTFSSIHASLPSTSSTNGTNGTRFFGTRHHIWIWRLAIAMLFYHIFTGEHDAYAQLNSHPADPSDISDMADTSNHLPPRRAGDEIDLKTLIHRLDTLYRSDTAYAEMEMIIRTPNWKRTLTMKSWSEGLDKTFIVITSPKREKGVATLRNGNEMWNFFPKINKVMKVPPSMMMGSWMGSDFTNDDLVKESTRMDDYDAKLILGENPNHYYIEFIPHEDAVSLWGKIISEIDKKTLLPVNEIFYDEKDIKVRELYFNEVKTIGGKTIPTVLELIPTTKKDHRTIVRYHAAQFDVPLKSSVFTLRNLKKKRR